MGGLKEIKVLSEPLTFELESNEILDPPRITLRMAPLSSTTVMIESAFRGQPLSLTDAMITTVLEAIQEWDLTDPGTGELLPCTPETKKRYYASLKILLGTRVKEKTISLFFELMAYASDLGNFLKN